MTDVDEKSPSTPAFGGLLVPVHLDALLVWDPETVLAPMADFSRLPYYDRNCKHNVNANVPYLSEEIVSHPFRDKNLRLGRGVHLHWALPDALTQGVSTANGVVFPAVPDRWLVTRSDRNGVTQKQWIVESDFLHPESDPQADPPSDAVSFPLPPRQGAGNGQPYRYLGRKWVVSDGIPSGDPEYLNALADDEDPHWHQVVSAGLTAIGYGEPSFAAFYPNCRSVFGLHDPDITNDQEFIAVRYDVIGWHDDPEKRDCLHSDVFGQTRKAIAKRIDKEYEASGHVSTGPSAREGVEIWHEALAHRFGWLVTRKWDATGGKWVDARNEPTSGIYKGPYALDLANTSPTNVTRAFYYASLTPAADGNGRFKPDPALTSGPVDIAVGNNASEALSAFLACRDPGDKAIVEEQLESLDLSHRLEHRQLDIGPKFREARHEKGFKSIRSGVSYTIRLERDKRSPDAALSATDATAAPAVKEVHAQTTGTLPAYLAHALNALNESQLAYLRAQDDIASLRLQIYHDWTLYMRALRPPDGLQSGYPDPIEIASFIEKTGLRALKRKVLATGQLTVSREQIDGQEGRDTPIDKAAPSSDTEPGVLASRVADCINTVIEGLNVTNAILDSLRRLDRVIAESRGLKSRRWELGTRVIFSQKFHDRIVWSARYSRDSTRIVMMSSNNECSSSTAQLLDAVTGRATHLPFEGGASGDLLSAGFDFEGQKIVVPSNGGTARIWDAKTGVQAQFEPPINHGSEVVAANYSPAGKRIVTAGKDGTVRVWSAETGKEVVFEEPINHGKKVYSANYDPAGTRIVTAGEDGTVRVWIAETGKEVVFALPIKHGTTDVYYANFDPAGERIVTAGGDGTARVWIAETGVELLLASPIKHGTLIFSANMDLAGEQIVTAGGDGTVRVWGAKTGVEVLLKPPIKHATDNVFSASFDHTGKRIVTAAEDGTVSVWEAMSIDDTLRLFLAARRIRYEDKDTVQILRNRIHQSAAALSDKQEHQEFQEQLAAIVPKTDSSQPPAARMRYALRQTDAPRYYQPTDPVVLLAGDDLKPTERHGTDGKDRDDGKLECKLFPAENFPAVKAWNKKVPDPLNVIRDAIFKETPDSDQIGARQWSHQPWHPFLMEWEVEMLPVSAGSNRDENRLTYASGFVVQNFTLPEAAVDLQRKPGASAEPRTADTGIYSGSCVLTDQAPDLLMAKLDRYLDKAEKSQEVKTDTETATMEKLRNIRDFLSRRHNTLSQALDGFHAALLQRHQILQLPISDPIGFGDLKRFTDEVRKATQGRHASSPLRDNDFTPIRSGTMKLRQLRLVDTFGRVKSLLDADAHVPIIASEPLRSPDAPNEIKLPPRLLQPARLNFRWLSADHAAGTEMDEPQTNAHPAFTPVCGWILPNHLDGSLMVYDNKGEALGTIIAVDGRPAWQPAPGGDLPRWEIENAESARMNPHLRKLINTIVNDLGKEDAHFFGAFLATLNNALESIAPEDFAHHESLAVLMGRPIAVVRAMVNLELRGQPAANQSLSAFLPDMERAVGMQTGAAQGQERRAQFKLAAAEKPGFLQALDRRDPAGIRPVFEKRELACALPEQNHQIAITVEAREGKDGRWLIHLPTCRYHVRQDAGVVHVYLHTARTTDDFCHVRFPIRIGEDQQLNDGLIGYFVEEVDGADYHYKDNRFCAPQAATRVPLSHSTTPAYIQQLADQLDGLQVPREMAQRLEQSPGAVVTVEAKGRWWKVNTKGHVYHLVRDENGIDVFEEVADARQLQHRTVAVNLPDMADQLDERTLPLEIASQLERPEHAVVTIDETGRRWRIDTAGHVYSLVRGETGIELFELLDASSEHIRVHWKEPVNLMQSVDDAPHKLTMLVDPQGSVHAVSGILPTKSISIPADFYAEALRSLEITFLSTPLLTERDKTRVPLAAQTGYQWSWLTRRGEAWLETGAIDRVETRAGFSSQTIVEGWLKLSKKENP